MSPAIPVPPAGDPAATRRPHPRRTRSGPVVGIAGVVAVLAALLTALLTGAAPASAADQPTADAGWLRVMHLSPDTGEAAVTLTAVNGSLTKTVTGVKFGDASDYMAVPAGSYVISLRPAHQTQVLLERSITVPKGKPITLTVTGNGGKLKTQLYSDDLVPVPAGKARVRVIQAASVHPTVTVRPRSGSVVLTSAGTGTPSAYRTVPAGPWSLTLQSGGTSATSTVSLASGTTTTVLVLDTAKKSLTAKAVVDSEAVSATPKGGVDTGAAPAVAAGALGTGATTTDRQHGTGTVGTGLLGIGLGVVVIGTLLLTRRVARRRTAERP